MSAPDTSAPNVLIRTAEALGTSPDTATLIRHHGTQVWHLPEVHAIVRISGLHHALAIERSLTLTHWLHQSGVPVTEPLLQEVFTTDAELATAWRFYPQPTHRHPTTADLGALLKSLHQAGPTPHDLHLPPAAPLSSLRRTLKTTTGLAPHLVAELHERIDHLLAAYADLDFPLGRGLIHGDAWMGNVLFDGDRPLLGDWDECAFGPRELDLANLWQGHRRFGRTRAELDAFTAAYGYDLSRWEGYEILTRIRDLHTLGSYVRAADRGDASARSQLLLRVATLDDLTASWVSR